MEILSKDAGNLNSRRWKTNLEREVTKVEEAQGVAPSEGREAEEALRAASVVAPA